MIVNSINISVNFSFQGTQYTPNICIDLDLITSSDSVANFYQLIALEHQIDTYSYLYEVMEHSELFYTEPQGLAKDFLTEAGFNLQAYIEHSDDVKLHNQLLEIVKKDMNISSFDDNLSLKAALLEAYQLGMDKSQ